ncbi:MULTISPECIES: ABC transporter permease [Thermus]|uniref:Spermidine/putrescine ABC transporter permease n=2 Tax=Thermus scotoductus TaxID=37636 RepID=A0A0N0ZSI1_THESC|nr:MULTISPECIES: ABC transporter permease [Thermus]ADW21381.1 spermidine/putrescine transport system permease protein PotB [Thermus scotoductus SA-01]KPD32183.1 spermidine/putrescine ABC transporter permease [Thermus scotoductus]
MNEAATPWQRAFRVLVTVGPGGLWLLVFVLLPTLLVLMASFLTRGPYGELTGPWGFHNYAKLPHPVYLEAFAQSLLVGVLATLISALLGYPLAFYIARHPRRDLLLFLLLLPFLTNFLIRVYAWLVLLQREGLVNALLGAFGLGPLVLYPSFFAVLLATVYTFLPFFVLPVYASVERLDWQLLEAAYDLGAKPVKAFLHAVLPQTYPGLFAGSVLVFIPAMGTFVVADLLGAGRVVLIGNLIQQQFGITRDWAFGAALSVFLMGFVLLSLYLYARLQGERGLKDLV